MRIGKISLPIQSMAKAVQVKKRPVWVITQDSVWISDSEAGLKKK